MSYARLPRSFNSLGSAALLDISVAPHVKFQFIQEK